MGAHETVEVYVQDLETLRVILMLGGTLLAAWWVGQLKAEAKVKKGPYELCKIHSRDISECRDMHDQEGKPK